MHGELRGLPLGGADAAGRSRQDVRGRRGQCEAEVREHEARVRLRARVVGGSVKGVAKEDVGGFDVAVDDGEPVGAEDGRGGGRGRIAGVVAW